MPRFLLRIEYAGTRYRGWQIQTNARTVQGEIARAAEDVLRSGNFELYGSGRTDAGVHALEQVAHLDTAVKIAPAALADGLNALLPADINILSAEVVDRRFHARHSATARSYVYQIARRRTAFAKPYVWWVRDPLDVARMRDVAAIFTGLHDFRAFSDDDPEEKSTKVMVESLTVEEEGDLLLVRIAGSHFIWKMVRRIVGIMVEAGKGSLDRRRIETMLHSDSELPAQLTAPASGLFLEKVTYPELRSGARAPQAQATTIGMKASFHSARFTRR
ncbi:MAG: tRNA pseudouridine(38-40) synthase TruA [Acidobacteriota bacterium]|nr:tRNA pseudouridine(38-40) synthase TruA [Acidobacteriota bacterium]